jgi:hypothetical protein
MCTHVTPPLLMVFCTISSFVPLDSSWMELWPFAPIQADYDAADQSDLSVPQPGDFTRASATRTAELQAAREQQSHLSQAPLLGDPAPPASHTALLRRAFVTLCFSCDTATIPSASGALSHCSAADADCCGLANPVKRMQHTSALVALILFRKNLQSHINMC